MLLEHHLRPAGAVFVHSVPLSLPVICGQTQPQGTQISMQVVRVCEEHRQAEGILNSFGKKNKISITGSYIKGNFLAAPSTSA